MDKLVLMSSFTAVVEQGSYTEAAKRLGKTKAIVSKQVSQLEEHLDIRLINRTTRTLAITDAGKEIYERCRQILDEVSVLESSAQGLDLIAGRIRISAPHTFGEVELMNLLTSFMQKHPHLQVELHLNDRFINLIEDGIDLAIRIGKMDDSNLIARKISEMNSVLVASPSWIAQNRPINEPKDLEYVDCLIDSNRRDGTRWSFLNNGKPETVKVSGRFTVNSAVASARAAIDGLGISLSPNFAVRQAIGEGKLQVLLEDYQPPQIGIYAVYPHRKHLATKVQALVDYLVEHWAEP